jgi:hypothetical protein
MKRMLIASRYSVMRRLVALWLLVSLLGYGLVWAMDLHESDANIQAVSMLTANAGIDAGTDPVDEHAVDTCCTHCCHGLSHLVAISTAHGHDFRPHPETQSGSDAVAFRSRSQSPDLRPPIA